MTYLIIGETEESHINTLDMLFEKFLKQSFRDFVEEDSADIHILNGKERSSIGIEDIKSLQSKFFFHPFEKPFQIGVIFEAEKLTLEAQNAFLKTLEESNDETVFILCVRNEKNLLPTIVSRGRKIFAPKTTPEDSEFENIDINNSLIDIFNKIEEVAKDNNTSLEFLNSLESMYRDKLEKSIQRTDKDLSIKIRDSLKNIQIAKMRILSNGNKRLVLENLILQLRK